MRDEFEVDEPMTKVTAKDDVELLTMQVDGVKMALDLGGVVRIQDHQGRVTCTAADLRRFLRTMDAAELSHDR